MFYARKKLAELV